MGKPITMLTASYGTTAEQCFTGGADGKIYEWNKTNCAFVVNAHTGPVFVIQPVAKVCHCHGNHLLPSNCCCHGNSLATDERFFMLCRVT